MDAPAKKPAKPRRSWLRFSMRTLLILVTVLSVPLGWVGWKLGQIRSERPTITWIEENGGGVYDQSWFSGRVERAYLNDPQVSELSPLTKLKSLIFLDLDDTSVSDLSPLAELKNLKSIWLNDTQVSDLSPLAELKDLTDLYIDNTQVSEEQVHELRQALPNCEIYPSIRVEK